MQLFVRKIALRFGAFGVLGPIIAFVARALGYDVFQSPVILVIWPNAVSFHENLIKILALDASPSEKTVIETFGLALLSNMVLFFIFGIIAGLVLWGLKKLTGSR